MPLALRLFGAAVALTAFTVSVAMAQEPSESAKRGYWWKAEQAPAEPEEPENEFPDLPPPPPESELSKLHPQQLEKLISDYREYALWKMEPEHVGWYYQLQDHARRRSRAFMNVTETVMLNQPSLNMNAEYPVTPPGQQARQQQREQSLTAGLAKGRNSAALVMLTRPGCPYCDAQRAALRYFQSRHGWQIREIDISKNTAAATRFGVDKVPVTVVIFRGTDQWMPVAVGVESVPRIEENTYRAMRLLKGETTAQQFTMQEFQAGGLLDPQRGNP